eukprot:scaffold196072_cov18-Tisochrysis_lutea.AAC.1
MAGPPAGSDNTVAENTWAKFRADYGVEKKNDLAAGMYALILTFVLSAAVHDLHAYPPRVAAMTGFIFCEWPHTCLDPFVCTHAFWSHWNSRFERGP